MELFVPVHMRMKSWSAGLKAVAAKVNSASSSLRIVTCPSATAMTSALIVTPCEFVNTLIELCATPKLAIMLKKAVRRIYTACFYQILAERQAGTISAASDSVVMLKCLASGIPC